MAEDTFKSSDSVRSGRPLRHVKIFRHDKPLKLELGGQLPEVTVAYEVYGRLNATADNAVLICHAISGDSHVAKHDEQDDAGWWDIVVGPGKAIDTDKYFVIGPNILGGCRGTTGPGSVNPAAGRPWGTDFPTITVDDIVQVQKLLMDHLGVRRLLGVIGGSMGGHQVLCWSVKYSGMVDGAMAVATSPRLTSQALAFDVVGRNAILTDPDYRGGQYYDEGPRPATGLAIARMLGHITYLSLEAMQDKFEADRFRPRDVPTEFEKVFSVGSYLAYHGDKFTERFDANSYLKLSLAMDLFDLGSTPEKLAKSLAASRCRWLVVSFTSDWLFPPLQSQQMVDALIAGDKRVSYCNVTSGCGHDAFLLRDDLGTYGELIRAFLANLSAPDGRPPAAKLSDSDTIDRRPTSIFHDQRLDYDMLINLIPEGATVLDLGCGGGSLLAMLREKKCHGLVGVELDERAIIACVRKGLDVIHADLNRGLSQFRTGQFDYVILSQTLQAVRDVESAVAEMLRVGQKCIVSFPNFGYWKLRKMLNEEGRAPLGGLLPYKWFETPNIRIITLNDFEDFCREKGISVLRRIALDTEAGREVVEDPNSNADTAIYVISG
ncbi:MAG: homoserine O-acetyltransferase [Planctomycetes bacterium]|nr:homoserine O-acetyltransferase [Planctomycetota bacterium]